MHFFSDRTDFLLIRFERITTNFNESLGLDFDFFSLPALSLRYATFITF